MNYKQAERLEQLAAEYVLGTLHGSARRRFDKLMMESYQVRDAVWQWEQQLNPLVDSLPETVPPKKIWKQIEQRIDPAPTPSNALFWWRGWAALSSAIVLVMAVLFSQVPFTTTTTTTTQPDRVAMFNDEQATPLWLVTSDSRNGKLMVKAINPQAVAVDNKAFELWMLPKQGQPTSLGILPVSHTRSETVLSPKLLEVLQNSEGLAISLEPVGGSPTGQPTGPIMYQAPVVSF